MTENNNDKTKIESYFKLRYANIKERLNLELDPVYLDILPENKSTEILDIGCGLCDLLFQLKNLGYHNLKGIDISKEAFEIGNKNGLDVEIIKSIEEYACNESKKYDFIILSHVLEHIDKNNIIPTLTIIKEKLLKPNGNLFIRVPNAQSNTGCYWAYEDFTHYTLFTTGSLNYVLKAAGFNTIEYLDPYNFKNRNKIKKIIQKLFLKLYHIKSQFWNSITNSAYHRDSMILYCYELKVLAS